MWKPQDPSLTPTPQSGTPHLLSPSRKLALGQEWRRPGDPPSNGPPVVEWGLVGCCRQVHARVLHPRLGECGTLAVGVPTGDSRSRKLGGRGMTSAGYQGPLWRWRWQRLGRAKSK